MSGPTLAASYGLATHTQLPQCACGEDVKVAVAGPNAKNPGRVYWSCPNAVRFDNTRGCTYWSWQNEQPRVPAQLKANKKRKAESEIHTSNGAAVVTGAYVAQQEARFAQFDEKLSKIIEIQGEIIKRIDDGFSRLKTE